VRIKEKNGLEVAGVALYIGYLCIFLLVISGIVLKMRTLSWVFTFIAMTSVVITFYLSSRGINNDRQRTNEYT